MLKSRLYRRHFARRVFADLLLSRAHLLDRQVTCMFRGYVAEEKQPIWPLFSRTNGFVRSRNSVPTRIRTRPKTCYEFPAANRCVYLPTIHGRL